MLLLQIMKYHERGQTKHIYKHKHTFVFTYEEHTTHIELSIYMSTVMLELA